MRLIVRREESEGMTFPPPPLPGTHYWCHIGMTPGIVEDKPVRFTQFKVQGKPGVSGLTIPSASLCKVRAESSAPCDFLRNNELNVTLTGENGLM